MASLVIIETADNQFYRVAETGLADLSHVWNGTRVKLVGGRWVDCKNARVELVRKVGARTVPVVSLASAKERAAKKQYADIVLSKFDDFEHADKRELLERKAAAENASRQRL